MNPVLILDGSRVHDIASFFDEVNRVFMAGEDWTLAPSLDALDDVLYGGYGALAGSATATLHWLDFEHCRQALGMQTTSRFLHAKLAEPGRYDTQRIARELAALEAGQGPTYFEIVLQIIAAHSNITLVPH